ncbi:hypothetical protein PoB_003525400 [Plakobranchus ocellatus]|uniref:Uncharacterized protein n=1 Tax=Plakobranchus ocellatus TaxID=259542 RepID=A0AAV4ALX0_9GAST|nr:hypothetical protein PoB_003525400 [Plakobranchus ocellatus]
MRLLYSASSSTLPKKTRLVKNLLTLYDDIIVKTSEVRANTMVLAFVYVIHLKSSVWFLLIASPQQGDLRLSGLLSGQGASGEARNCDRRVPADLRADSLATVPPSPLEISRSITKA